MPISLILYICLGVASLAIAAYVILAERSRRAIVSRAGERAGVVTVVGVAAKPRSAGESIIRRAAVFVPETWASDTKTGEALVQAGYDGPLAPLAYGAIRIAVLVGIPLLVGLVASTTSFSNFVFYVGAAAVIALILPKWYLIRAVRLRQERVRRSLPDALDLLVVCIEAGISLDAAILRVAKDLGTAHPELANELIVVNRKTNAGMPRSDALYGLWARTGVEEVRALITHIVQGEKWGTSSGKVLRVYSETLRRQRRQAAEKKAATAPVKMLVPLAIFIFPALLMVILGPVMMNVMTLFKQ